MYNDSYQNHNKSTDFKCDNCDASFKRKVDLKRHENSLHFGQKHNCRLCGLNYTTFENLIQHVSHVHDKLEKFECEICQNTFSKKSSYERHIAGRINEDGSC